MTLIKIEKDCTQQQQQHDLVAQSIALFLKAGGTVRFILNCTCCSSRGAKDMRGTNVMRDFLIRDADGTKRADLAILTDSGDAIKALIEVYTTCRTTEGTVARDSCEWFEVDVREVAVMCRVEKPKNVVWTMADIRSRSECVKCFAKPSLLELAKLRGVYRPKKQNPLLEDIHVAMHNYINPVHYAWRTPPTYYRAIHDKYGLLAREISARGKCLRCECDYGVTVHYPFCKVCYSKVTELTERHEQDRVFVSDSTALYLHWRFDWLRHRPRDKNACSECKTPRSECNSFLPPLVEYYGRRDICEPCFVKKQIKIEKSYLDGRQCESARKREDIATMAAVVTTTTTTTPPVPNIMQKGQHHPLEIIIKVGSSPLSNLTRLELAERRGIYKPPLMDSTNERHHARSELSKLEMSAYGGVCFSASTYCHWVLCRYDQSTDKYGALDAEIRHRGTCLRCDVQCGAAATRPVCRGCFKVISVNLQKRNATITTNRTPLLLESEDFLWLREYPCSGKTCTECKNDKSKRVYYFGNRDLCESCFIVKQSKLRSLAQVRPRGKNDDEK